MYLNNELFLRMENGNLIYVFLSNNEPSNKLTATGVLSINLVNKKKEEDFIGEMDITGQTDNLNEYIDDILEFIDYSDMEYEIISKKQFESMKE